MSAPAFLVLTILCVSATGNWIAVVRANKPLEYLFKPLTTLGLLALALTVEPFDDTVRSFFVVALLLSLAGDVFLMLPRDLFIPGLFAFLMAHVAYVAGMAQDDLQVERLGVGTAVAVVVLGGVGFRIARDAYRTAPALALAVVAYILVIGSMLVAAVGTGRPAAIIGAALFVGSDALIGWTKFVRPTSTDQTDGRRSRAPVVIMVTYHMGQAGLVLSLADHGLWALLGFMAVMGVVLVSLLE